MIPSINYVGMSSQTCWPPDSDLNMTPYVYQGADAETSLGLSIPLRHPEIGSETFPLNLQANLWPSVSVQADAGKNVFVFEIQANNGGTITRSMHTCVGKLTHTVITVLHISSLFWVCLVVSPFSSLFMDLLKSNFLFIHKSLQVSLHTSAGTAPSQPAVPW